VGVVGDGADYEVDDVETEVVPSSSGGDAVVQVRSRESIFYFEEVGGTDGFAF